MKGFIVLGNGFEDTEAICTIDILNRAKISLDVVRVEDNATIITQYDNKIVVEKSIKDMNIDNYDFLIIPGGRAVEKVLVNSKPLEKAIKIFFEKKKLMCAICAGPLVIGRLGYLENIKYTCFPGYNTKIKGIYTNKSVTVSDNIITAKSMAYTIDFALEIVNYLLGKEKMKQIEKMIYAKE